MAMKEDVIVQCKELSWEISKKKILNNINLNIIKGEKISLVGLNGAGKSSLCKHILGLLKPTKGKVIYQPGLRVSYVPQLFRVSDVILMTIDDFMRLSLKSYASHRIQSLLEDVGLWEKKGQMLHLLSGGEQQRLLIAKALLKEADLLVLDEAFNHISLAGQRQLIELIDKERQRLGFAILSVSHDMFGLMSSSDRIICINHSILCSASPSEILNNTHLTDVLGQDFTNNLRYHIGFSGQKNDIDQGSIL